MPTFESSDRFWNDYDRLKQHQRLLFKAARNLFIAALLDWEQLGCPGLPICPASLRVKDVKGHRSCWELTWENSNGRCTWEYGTPITLGKAHVVWRRIGGHEIFNDP